MGSKVSISKGSSGGGGDEGNFRLGIPWGYLRRRLDEGCSGTGEAAGLYCSAVANNFERPGRRLVLLRGRLKSRLTGSIESNRLIRFEGFSIPSRNQSLRRAYDFDCPL
jgi:hypothetical protein